MERSAAAAMFAVLSLALGACPSTPAPVPPSLVLRAHPTRIAPDGTATTLRVEATDADGGLGAGQVSLSAPAGQFPDGAALSLDANGTASARFACDVAADVGCAANSVTVTATWTPHGDPQVATALVTLFTPTDGGASGAPDAGVTPSGPCAIGPDGGPWLDVEPLADWASYDAPNHLVALNPTQHAVDVLDTASGAVVSHVALGGTPTRLVANPATHTALVVHGLGGPARLDVVDLAGQSFASIPLTFDGDTFLGLDVAFGEPGTAVVLTSFPWTPSQDAVVLDVDLVGLAVRARRNVKSGAKTTSFSAPRVGYGDGVVYFGNEALRAADAGAGWGLETDVTFEALFDFPNHLQVAPDGAGVLYPTVGDLVTEYDPSTGAMAHRYALVSADAIDVAYSHDGAQIGALLPKNGELWVSAFDRQSQALRATGLVGIWAQTYSRQMLAYSSDDAALYVYASTVSPPVSRVMCLQVR